ncbi:MAG: sn-glycerol-3-phosphate ABC transporter substrate-binding protein, partial [Aurantimonas coralicida]|nr:sn-glycerol-3-phosphate ABC transporter substrate-binding protein [Aurantimonas coralicida]
MMNRKILGAAVALGALVAGAGQAVAVTELQWWHAMSGANNEVVDTLAKEFNESQDAYKITPVFKGTYPETLNAGIAAFRAKQPPAIIQVFDVGTGVMMGAEGAVMPVADVLEAGGY